MDNEKLERIEDNLLLFFPFFYKKLMKGADEQDLRLHPTQQYPLLGRLMSEGDLPMSELGKRIFISKPNMTPLIDKLVIDGKVKRIPDNTDRRIINISITEKGRHFMGEHKKMLKANIKRNLSTLSEKDIETLYMSLENIKNILSKI